MSNTILIRLFSNRHTGRIYEVPVYTSGYFSIGYVVQRQDCISTYKKHLFIEHGMFRNKSAKIGSEIITCLERAVVRRTAA